MAASPSASVFAGRVFARLFPTGLGHREINTIICLGKLPLRYDAAATASGRCKLRTLLFTSPAFLTQIPEGNSLELHCCFGE